MFFILYIIYNMIPFYNTDLSGESNLNRAKRRVISQMSRAYSSYPASFLTDKDVRYSRRMDMTISGILNQIDTISSALDTIADSLDFDGYNSSFKSSAEYIEDLAYLRTLVDESIPKLNRYFEFLYKNISTLSLADFISIKKALEGLAEKYFDLKRMSIRDENASSVFGIFRYIDDERSSGLPKEDDDMFGGAGGRPRGRPRKIKPEDAVGSQDISQFFTPATAVPTTPATMITPSFFDDEDEVKEEVSRQETKDDRRVRTDQRKFLRPSPTTRLTFERRPKEEGDVLIERSVLWSYWKKLIDLMEGATGIFPRWFSISQTFNEKRPTLKVSPATSDKVEVDEDTGELLGGRYYDAGKPYIPPMYV